jgi:hypothetical protein
MEPLWLFKGEGSDVDADADADADAVMEVYGKRGILGDL